jgi:hypothetical protein
MVFWHHFLFLRMVTIHHCPSNGSSVPLVIFENGDYSPLYVKWFLSTILGFVRMVIIHHYMSNGFLAPSLALWEWWLFTIMWYGFSAPSLVLWEWWLPTIKYQMVSQHHTWFCEMVTTHHCTSMVFQYHLSWLLFTIICEMVAQHHPWFCENGSAAPLWIVILWWYLITILLYIWVVIVHHLL